MKEGRRQWDKLEEGEGRKGTEIRKLGPCETRIRSKREGTGRRCECEKEKAGIQSE
jgi:hypothetical protein